MHDVLTICQLVAALEERDRLAADHTVLMAQADAISKSAQMEALYVCVCLLMCE
jgi:NAD/NADP transhydrogenase alpha subunit